MKNLVIKLLKKSLDLIIIINIIDEPTSSIDPLVEEKILLNILNQTAGKTAIIISHRLSLCTRLDKVAYMENGHIVEMGTHEQLMKKKDGKYKTMFNKQAHWYLDNKKDKQ